MAVHTVFKVSFVSDKDFLPEQVEKTIKTIKGFLPIFQMLLDRVGLRKLQIKLEDNETD